MDHRRLREILLAEEQAPEFIRKLQVDNSFNAYHNALNKSLKDWLGPNHDPSSKQYQGFRNIGNKIINKFIKSS